MVSTLYCTDEREDYAIGLDVICKWRSAQSLRCMACQLSSEYLASCFILKAGLVQHREYNSCSDDVFYVEKSSLERATVQQSILSRVQNDDFQTHLNFKYDKLWLEIVHSVCEIHCMTCMYMYMYVLCAKQTF